MPNSFLTAFELLSDPEPTDPSDPTVDPDDLSVDPDDPDPTDPTDPDPTDSSDPDPTDPSDPDPIDPSDPSDPGPTDPTDPDPTGPSDPDPTDPSDPTVDPDDSSADPDDPGVDPDDPGVDPDDPSTDPDDPGVEPDDPSVEPDDPDPTDPTDPTDPDQESNAQPEVSDLFIGIMEDDIYMTASFFVTDADSDDTHIFSIQSDPDQGSVTNNGDGTFTFMPGDEFNSLPEGASQNVSFIYTATDDSGETNDTSAPATVTITVIGRNDAPVVDTDTPLTDQTDGDGDSITPVDVSDGFYDPDSGDTASLIFSAAGLPLGLSIDPGTGVISGTVDNNASLGGPQENGVYTVTVKGKDPHGESAVSQFTWTIDHSGPWSYFRPSQFPVGLVEKRNPTPISDWVSLSSNQPTLWSMSWPSPNSAPTATDNSVRVTDKRAPSASGNLITDDDGFGVDSDPNGGVLSVSDINDIINDGENVRGDYGSLSWSDDGSYTYTLDGSLDDVTALAEGQKRTDAFTYTLSDEDGATDTAALTITVTGTNDAPSVDTDNPLTNQTDGDNDEITPVDVSDGFYDPDSGETALLTFSADGLPGGLSIDSDTGVISGTVDSNASGGGPDNDGTYTVTVTAEDPHGENATSQFTWTIDNLAPTATDNTADVKDKTALSESGNLITDDDGFGQDSNLNDGILRVSEINGVTDESTDVTGQYGTLSWSSDGSYRYILDDSLDGYNDVKALAEGEEVIDTFDYTLSDQGGSTDTATLTVTITGTNDQPLAPDIQLNHTIDNNPETAEEVITGAFEIIDPDTNDSHSFTILSQPADGTVTNNGDGTFTFDPGSDFDDLEPDESRTVTFSYTATDDSDADNAESTEGLITITITNDGAPSNSQPTASGITVEIDEDSATGVTESFSVTDPDDEDSHTFTMETGPEKGSVTNNGDGTFTFHPGDDFETLAEGDTETVSFPYTVTDDSGMDNDTSDPATVTITITGINDQPVVPDIQLNHTIDNDPDTQEEVITGAFEVTDPDTNDSHSFTILSQPADGTVTNNGDGTFTFDPGSDFDDLEPDESRTVTFSYTATDDSDADNAESTEGLITITITNDDAPSNSQPTASDITVEIDEDSATGVTESFSVTDSDDEDSHTFVMETGPEKGSVTNNGDGTFTFHPGDDFETLAEGDTETVSFTYNVTDDSGMDNDTSNPATVTVTITGTNDAPEVSAPIADQVDGDADSVTLDVSSSFTDADNGESDALNFSATGLPSGLSMNGSTGVISGIIDEAASLGGPVSAGVYHVTVTAQDPSGESVSDAFTWTIDNMAPTATDNTAEVTEESRLTDTGNLITDDDGFGVDSDTSHGTLTIAGIEGVTSDTTDVTGNYGILDWSIDGSYTYTLDNGNATVDALAQGEEITDVFTYTLSDEDGATDTAALTVTVTGTNDAPSVDTDNPLTDQTDGDNDEITPVDVSDGFYDPDSGETALLTFSADGLPGGLSIDPDTGVISGTVDGAASSSGGDDGIYTVTVTAEDPHGESAASQFTWTIDNLAPTATDNSAKTTEDGTTTASGNLITDNDGYGVDSDVSGGVLTVSDTNGISNDSTDVIGTYGTLNWSCDGSYTYTLNNDATAVQALAKDETVTDVFTYTLADEGGATDTAALTVTVTGTNDAPSVDTDNPLTDQADGDNDEITPVDVSDGFYDPDSGETALLTFSADGLPGGLSIDPGTGVISGTVDGTASIGGPDEDGIYPVTVTAGDPHGESAASQFTWTIDNLAPTATDNSAETTEEVSTTASGNLITDDDGFGMDSDTGGSVLTVSDINGISNDSTDVTGTYGTLNWSCDGSYTYTLDNAATVVQALAKDETVTDLFTYTLSDEGGETDTAALTVTVTGTNDAPVADMDNPLTDQTDGDNDEIAPVNVSDVFYDPDSGETASLTFSVTNLPEGLSIDSDTGVISGTVDGTASIGGSGEDGIYTVTVTAEDTHGENAASQFTWTIDNLAPTATDNSAQTTEEGTTTATGNLITDDDGFGMDSDTGGSVLTVSDINGISNDSTDVTGTYGTLNWGCDGSYTYTLDNDATAVQALAKDETVTDLFTYTLADEGGATDTAALTVTVTGTNDAPSVDTDNPLTDQADGDNDEITPVDVSDGFYDPDSGETASLTFSADGLPEGLSIDPGTGVISGTVDGTASIGGSGEDGIYTVTVTAEDTHGESAASQFTWTIDNLAPTATDNTADVKDKTTLSDSGNLITDDDGFGVDNDNDGGDAILNVSKINDISDDANNVSGAYGSLSWSRDGSYTYTLDGTLDDVKALAEGEERTEAFTYTLTDAASATDTAALTVTVTGTNDQPLAPDIQLDQTIDNDPDTQEDSITGAFEVTDPDTDDSHHFTILSQPASGTVTNNDEGTFTFDPGSDFDNLEPDESRTVTFSYTATDDSDADNAESTEGFITITITNDGTNTPDSQPGASDSTNDDDPPPNSQPGASGITVEIDEDSATGVTESFSVADPDDEDSHTFAMETQPAKGSVTNNEDGTFTFDPGDDFETLAKGERQTVTFTYTATDDSGADNDTSDPATVTVTITGANDAPEIVDGAFIADQTDGDNDEITPLDVSTVFTDIDTGDTENLAFSATSLPVGLSIDPDTGVISGTISGAASLGGPASDGVYHVTVTAQDPSGESVSDEFTWIINNLAPTATDNSASVTEDSGATDTGNLITDDDGFGMDSDTGGGVLSISQIDGITSDTTSVSGNYGSLDWSTDGSYTYTLNNGNSNVQALGEGEEATEVFTYTLEDENGGTDTAQFTVTITGTNDVPEVSNALVDRSDGDGDAVTVDLSASFTDPDNGDSEALTFAATGLPSGLGIDSSTGIINGTISGNASLGGPASDGVYSVTITVEDPQGGTVSDTFTWTIDNLAPTATDNTTDVTDKATLTNSGNLITDDDGFGQDSDTGGETLVISEINGITDDGTDVAGQYGTLSWSSDGSFTYTLDGALDDVKAIAEGEQVTEAFEYTLSDEGGATDTATLTVTITGANDSPEVITGSIIDDQTSNDGDEVAPLDVSTIFTDVDTGDAANLVFSAQGLPTGLSIDSSTGIISGTVDGIASSGGTQGDDGDGIGLYSVTVTAQDSKGATVSEEFTWTVNNIAPVATDNTASVTEDSATTYSGNLITDDDSSGVDSDTSGSTLVVEKINGVTDDSSSVTGSYGSLAWSSNGSYTYTLSNGSAQTLAAGQQVSDIFEYTLSDTNAGTDTATLTVTITGRNDSPSTGGTIADQTSNDDDAVNFDPNAAGLFSDIDNGNSFTYSATGLPDGLSVNSGSGVISGTISGIASNGGIHGADNNGIGIYEVTFTAQDSAGATASTSFTWTVNNVVPAANNDTASLTEDDLITVTGNLTDNDIDTTSTTFTVTQIGGEVNDTVDLVGTYGTLDWNSDGSYTFTLDNDAVDVQKLNDNTVSENFEYIITDGHTGVTDSATLTVNITGKNDAPEIDFPSEAPPSGAAPPGAYTSSYNNHYYQYVSTGMTFDGAVTAAEALAPAGWTSHLVTINDADEQTHLQSIYTGDAWGFDFIGGKQVSSGVNEWITGEPFTYVNFNTNHPATDGYGFVFTGSGYGYGWQSLADDGTTGYIVEYEPDGVGAAITIDENQTIVMTVTATDPDSGDTLTYSTSGGSDQALFSIDATTGELTFNVAPDYENPGDADGNNIYEVTVQVSDGSLTDTQNLSIEVLDVVENQAPVMGSNLGLTLSLDGSTGRASTTTAIPAAVQAFDTSSLSLSGAAWVKYSGTGTQLIICIADTDNANQKSDVFHFRIHNGQLEVGIDDGTWWTSTLSTESVPTDTWTHVAFSFENDSVDFYINGEEAGSNLSFSTRNPVNMDTITIGANYMSPLWETIPLTNELFNGQINEAHLWNSALTQADIQTYMTNSPSGGETGLLGLWQFDEEGGTVASDSSTSGNDLTLSGGASLGSDFTDTDTSTPSTSRTVADLLSKVTHYDADGNPVGIAVTAATVLGTGGAWEYSTDNSTWTNFGAVSAGSALLLDPSTYVRYNPNGDATTGNATMSIRAWDQTSGTASTDSSPAVGDTSTNGGGTAYSSGSKTLNIVVNAANTAPVISNLDATPSYTIGNAAIQLDADVSVSDAEMDFTNYNGATLTLQRNGGANANDSFTNVSTSNLSALTEGGVFNLGGADIGTVTTNSGGTLQLSFNSSATQTNVNEVLQSIAYSNTAGSSGAISLDWSFSDGINTTTAAQSLTLQALQWNDVNLGISNEIFEVVDIDNNGKLDIAVYKELDLTAYIQDVSDGTFTDQMIHSFDTLVLDLASANLDNNVYYDIATAGIVSIVFLNDGTSFNDSLQNFTFEPVAVTTGDLDGDGDIDMVLLVQDYFPKNDLAACCCINNGTGSFTQKFIENSNPPTYHSSEIKQALLADVDTDGKLDVIRPITNDPADSAAQGDITMWINNHDFTNYVLSWNEIKIDVDDIIDADNHSVITDFNPSGIAIADLDCDGKNDIAIYNYTTVTGNEDQNTLLIGLRNSTNDGYNFTKLSTSLDGLGNNVHNMTAGDYNGDGSVDLLLSHSAGITLLKGDGSGGFTETSISTTASNDSCFADMNNDGKTDIVADIDGNVHIFYQELPPVMINLGQSPMAFTLLDISSTVFDASGKASGTLGWAGPDEGILAIDMDGDNKVSDPSEFVFTDHAPEAETDMEALQLAFDSNDDHRLTPEDKRWEDFGIWQDWDSDGQADDGEFLSLDELNITAIDLDTEPVDSDESTPAPGVFVLGVSEVYFEDGSTTTAADISLGYLSGSETWA